MLFVYLISGLLMGIVFGAALEKGRVFEPGMIVGQFQLRNFLMVKMFLSAIAATAIVFAILTELGWAEFHPKPAAYPAVIAGGLLFGAGMALAGACPGTVLAQIGAGYRDAWAIVAGGLAGAMTYGYLHPAMKTISAGPGGITLASISGWPFSLLALVLAAVIAVALILLERRQPWREELGEDFDGEFD